MPNDLKLTFSTSKKGYDPVEVDKAINDMFRDIKLFEDQGKKQAETIKQQEEAISKLEQARERECAQLAKLVTAAASIADAAEAEAVAKAEELTRSARQMVADAEEKVKEIELAAKKRAEQLEQEISARTEEIKNEAAQRAEKYEKDASERAEMHEKDMVQRADKIISDARATADEIRVQAENYLAMVKKDYSGANVVIAKLQGEIKAAQEKNSQIATYLDELVASVSAVGSGTGALATPPEEAKDDEPTTYTINPVPKVIEQRNTATGGNE